MVDSARHRYHDGAVLLVVAGVLALASLAGPWHLHRTIVYVDGVVVAERTESYQLLWGDVSDRGPAGERRTQVGTGTLGDTAWRGAFTTAFVLVAVAAHALIYAGARGIRASRPGGGPWEGSGTLTIFAFLVLSAAPAVVLIATSMIEGSPAGGKAGEAYGQQEWWSPGPAFFLCGISITLTACGARVMRTAQRENVRRSIGSFADLRWRGPGQLAISPLHGNGHPQSRPSSF